MSCKCYNSHALSITFSFMSTTRSTLPGEIIEQKIYLIRGHKVMLSHDLSALYEVEPRALVQAVKRNIERFLDDFIFQLAKRSLAS